jgi:hypothetical protein
MSDHFSASAFAFLMIGFQSLLACSLAAISIGLPESLSTLLIPNFLVWISFAFFFHEGEYNLSSPGLANLLMETQNALSGHFRGQGILRSALGKTVVRREGLRRAFPTAGDAIRNTGLGIFMHGNRKSRNALRWALEVTNFLRPNSAKRLPVSDSLRERMLPSVICAPSFEIDGQAWLAPGRSHRTHRTDRQNPRDRRGGLDSHRASGAKAPRSVCGG